MKVQIVGIQKGQSRNGRSFSNIYFTKEFTPYEVENSGSCMGLKVGTEFTYVDVNCKPGDVCEFSYEPGYQDKATLTNITVLKSSPDNK